MVHCSSSQSKKNVTVIPEIHSKPYIRTWASTKESVKNASEQGQPCDAVHKVIADDLGGTAACSSVETFHVVDSKLKIWGNPQE